MRYLILHMASIITILSTAIFLTIRKRPAFSSQDSVIGRVLNWSCNLNTVQIRFLYFCFQAFIISAPVEFAYVNLMDFKLWTACLHIFWLFSQFELKLFITVTNQDRTCMKCMFFQALFSRKFPEMSSGNYIYFATYKQQFGSSRSEHPWDIFGIPCDL